MQKPVAYSDEIAMAFLRRVSDGESLRKICAEPDMPSIPTVWQWREDSAFDQRYVRAKQLCADAMVEDIQAISDDLTDDPNSRRVRTDARKWIASKLLPKVYGDRVALEAADDRPIQISWISPKA